MPPFTATRPIATRAEYEAITAQMVAIAEEMAAGDLSRRDSYRLMSLLCQAYDRDNLPAVPPAKSHELLADAMEAHGLRQTDLVGTLGDAAAVSSILAGRRPIPRAAAFALQERFGYDFPGLVAAEAVARAAARRKPSPARRAARLPKPKSAR